MATGLIFLVPRGTRQQIDLDPDEEPMLGLMHSAPTAMLLASTQPILAIPTCAHAGVYQNLGQSLLDLSIQLNQDFDPCLITPDRWVEIRPRDQAPFKTKLTLFSSSRQLHENCPRYEATIERLFKRLSVPGLRLDYSLGDQNILIFFRQILAVMHASLKICTKPLVGETVIVGSLERHFVRGAPEPTYRWQWRHAPDNAVATSLRHYFGYNLRPVMEAAAWVELSLAQQADPSGVRIRPDADMGWGVYTGLKLFIKEEEDIHVSQLLTLENGFMPISSDRYSLSPHELRLLSP